MKRFALIVLLGSSLYSISAQCFIQSLGFNYSQTTGAFGNSDMMSLQYAPQWHYNKGKLIYGFSSPMCLGLISSSSRDNSNRMKFEIPLSFEMGFNPGSPCSSFKTFSIFAGIGISRQMQVFNSIYSMDYMNSTLGIRFAPFDIPMEIRFIGSKPTTNSKIFRIGLGIAAIL